MNQAVKIAMILDSDFPPDPRVRNEAQVLIQAGYEVHLFCLDYRGTQPPKEKFLGINVHRYRIKPWMHSISSLAYTIPLYHYLLQKSIQQFLDEVAPDILHTHDMQVARAVFRSNKSRVPVVLDLHENRPAIMKFYEHVKKFPGKWLIHPHIWKKFETKYIHQADRVITVTPEAKSYYVDSLREPADKFTVVPNTVSEQFYENYHIEKSKIEKFKNHFVVLYLGDTGLRRGLAEVIQALPLLIKKIPEIKLVIVGKSKSDDDLKSLAKSLQVDPWISFEGYQNVKYFPSYVLASQIGISPLHRNLHHDTTYANKLFQYLSFARPVVVSNCTAQKKIVDKYHCGLVFKDRDSQDFAKKILDLYANPERRNQLGLNGKHFIEERFTWKKISPSLIEMYQSFKIS
ncbi:MAG: glycosyltransferase family 4 protein [Saprospiraceae bacterium]